MKSEETQTVISIPSSASTGHGSSSSVCLVKRERSEVRLGGLLQVVLGRNRYKLMVLVAILVLAIWSMFTSSLTLKFTTTGYLTRFSDKLSFPVDDDLDILVVEEKKKVVRHMWDLYSHGNGGYGSSARLPRFWQDAFRAAYEDLSSEVGSVRDAAISEIAKLFVRSLLLDLPPLDDDDDHRSSTPNKTNGKSGREKV